MDNQDILVKLKEMDAILCNRRIEHFSAKNSGAPSCWMNPQGKVYEEDPYSDACFSHKYVAMHIIQNLYFENYCIYAKLHSVEVEDPEELVRQCIPYSTMLEDYLIIIQGWIKYSHLFRTWCCACDKNTGKKILTNSQKDQIALMTKNYDDL